MNYKKFTSQSGWFSLTLPEEWDEYDDGEENTYAFFNSKSWTGNFRITPFQWTDVADPTEDKAAQFIADEMKDNNASIKIKIGDFESVHYKKDFRQDSDSLVVYYWTIGKNNNLFICSFTINKEQEETKENQEQLQIVQNIIRSMKIN
jgi:hypothetical protein